FPILRCSSKAVRRRKLRLRFAFSGALCLEKNLRGLKISRYCVAPQKQLDVGNYAFALLFPVRCVLKKICAALLYPIDDYRKSYLRCFD
ncbi:MAG: hypothetical protein J6L83_01470, partial [Clostridia bacterium]|nr:hypothetical protein [Clostridia bacterium]